ncbi:MAG: type II toxin-antitoxin system VapC family toxin [Alcaligenaceae bacterium]|nr:type II toxin-antitoxin system VapC family toxin [Alcaligenaceae bacterium]
MKIIADTNILVRAIVEDDLKQAKKAQKILLEASLVAITPIALCELYWVLKRAYKITEPDIENVIRTLTSASNVRTDLLAINAGLKFMNNGGDFADGVLWFLGTKLGGQTFVSFDKKAVTILKEMNASANLL